ncbi:MAG: hypothetical protein DMG26_08670 [Acidobacteria bacterium]|nr:MAG: hypothetical protein DMG26_08670 [Acidobacteriota bacterium]
MASGGVAAMVQQPLAGISWRNQLYCGDCLAVLDAVPDESVDLIYIDPPFYSQRVYETIWGEEAERFAFEDRWSGGINHYVNHLVARIRKMYSKLKAAGSFYVHLDWHIAHYMKIELDKVRAPTSMRRGLDMSTTHFCSTRSPKLSRGIRSSAPTRPSMWVSSIASLTPSGVSTASITSSGRNPWDRVLI